MGYRPKFQVCPGDFHLLHDEHLSIAMITIDYMLSVTPHCLHLRHRLFYQPQIPSRRQHLRINQPYHNPLPTNPIPHPRHKKPRPPPLRRIQQPQQHRQQQLPRHNLLRIFIPHLQYQAAAIHALDPAIGEQAPDDLFGCGFEEVDEECGDYVRGLEGGDVGEDAGPALGEIGDAGVGVAGDEGTDPDDSFWMKAWRWGRR